MTPKIAGYGFFFFFFLPNRGIDTITTDDNILNRVRLDRRVKKLVEVLIEELDCSRSFLLHVGPRATRRAVSLLVRLGRASEVCRVHYFYRGNRHV